MTVQAGLCQTLSETPKISFLALQPTYFAAAGFLAAGAFFFFLTPKSESLSESDSFTDSSSESIVTGFLAGGFLQ